MTPDKLESLFNLAIHMGGKDTAGTDYTFKGETAEGKKVSVVLNAKQQVNVMTGALQAFIHDVGMRVNHNGTKGAIQAFNGSPELPKLSDAFDVVPQKAVPDLAWQKAYKPITLGQFDLEWDIAQVGRLITFDLVPEGAKVKIADVSGEATPVKVKKYGAGIGITWEIMQGRKLWRFVDLLEQTRIGLYDLWANIHYGLLMTAAALHNIAYQGGATVLEKDIATINAGGVQIATANKDKGYGDVANAPLILYAGVALRGRIMAAMNATANPMTTGKANATLIDFPVDVNFTQSSQITANKAILLLPGNKIQNAIKLREMGLSRQEIESLADIRTYWTAFGAAVGDDEQVVQLSFT